MWFPAAASRDARKEHHPTRKERRRRPTSRPSTSLSDVIRLAGRGGTFELDKEFGVSADASPPWIRPPALAMAAGLDALRDAGIPLVMHYKTTSRGTQLPDRWMIAGISARRYRRDLRLSFSRLRLLRR